MKVFLQLDDEAGSDSNDTTNASWTSALNTENCIDEVLKVARLPVLVRSSCLPAVLPALVKVMPEIGLSNAIIVMKYVVLWAHLISGQERALQALRNFVVLYWSGLTSLRRAPTCAV